MLTGDQWRINSRKNEETEPKQKQHPVVGVTGDGSKVRCTNIRGKALRDVWDPPIAPLYSFTVHL